MTTFSPPSAAVTDRRLNAISLVLVLGAFTTLLDTTIVNIALDHLHTAFGASVAQTQWVTTAYLLAFVAVIPVSGWFSERIGSRNAWMVAVGTFLAGSILCGVVDSLPALIGFRVLQGIGGGMVLPITISILTRAAGKPRIGRAMIAVALPAQLAPILGSVLGGLILQSLHWHWLFFVNVPFCLAALALGPWVLPATSGVRHHRFDFLGFALLTPAIVAIAYGVSQAPEHGGFLAVAAWSPIAGGIALLTAFAFHSLRARRPALLDVRLFTRRSFGLTSIITFVSGFSVYAVMFLLPLFYQQVRGESVLATGLLLIPQGLGTMLFFLVLRRFAAAVDARIVVAAGVLMTMIGILPFALAGAEGGTALMLAGQVLQGIGFGAATFPVMTLAFASLGHDEAPRGSAAFSVVQRVGAPFGVAVIAIILQNLLDDATTQAGQLAAFAHSFWWTIGLSAVPLLIAFFLPAAETSNEPAPSASVE